MQTQAGSGGSLTPANSSSNNTYTEVYDYLLENGLNPVGAAGIMGNLQQESSMDPGMYGGGLAQWGGQRLTNLDNYAAQQGESPESLQAQLGFLIQELESGQYGTIQALDNESSPAAAAVYFQNNYEKPATGPTENTAGREQYATEIYNHFVNGAALNLSAASGTFDGPPVPGTTTDSGTTGFSTSGPNGNILTNTSGWTSAILGFLGGLSLIVLGIWIAFNPFSDLTTAISGAVKEFTKMPVEGLTQRVRQAPNNVRKRRDANNERKLLNAAGRESDKVTQIGSEKSRPKSIRASDIDINSTF